MDSAAYWRPIGLRSAISFQRIRWVLIGQSVESEAAWRCNGVVQCYSPAQRDPDCQEFLSPPPPFNIVYMQLAATLTRLFTEARPAGVTSAYLFGSHAEGRAHRESDIDFGVLLQYERFPQVRERFEERVRLTNWLLTALGIDSVDVAILNDAPPLFGRRIVTQGRKIYCADAAADHAFVRDVQLRAADLEPFLRRTRRIKLEALTRR